jgi:hypothetical protein
MSGTYKVTIPQEVQSALEMRSCGTFLADFQSALEMQREAGCANRPKYPQETELQRTLRCKANEAVLALIARDRMAVNLSAMTSQRDSWEAGYYRELTRRKELEKMVHELIQMLEERNACK